MAAAVGDYRSESLAQEKMKRGPKAQRINLVQNSDILKEVNALKKNQVVVGFAAETGNLVAEAERKLTEKGLDLIVANEVDRPDSGFAVDTNEVTLVSREEAPVQLPLMSKEEVAERILDWLVTRLPGQEAGSVVV
jgi:phosphopantothenoylcysteine decarboxylase/phosphopantothenate--cysteine ligase